MRISYWVILALLTSVHALAAAPDGEARFHGEARFAHDYGVLDTEWGRIRCFKSVRPKAMPVPEYPVREKKAGIAGVTLCAAYVSEEGVVVDVKIMTSSGNEALDLAALKTMRRCRFRPLTERDAPIAFVTLQPIRFSADS